MQQWWWFMLPPLCQCRTRDLIQGSVSVRNGIPRNLVTPGWLWGWSRNKHHISYHVHLFIQKLSTYENRIYLHVFTFIPFYAISKNYLMKGRGEKRSPLPPFHQLFTKWVTKCDIWPRSQCSQQTWSRASWQGPSFGCQAATGGEALIPGWRKL